MTTVLDQICADKKHHIRAMKAHTPVSDLQRMIEDIPPTRSFLMGLKKKDRKYSIIAEVKKASPSKGVIREDFDAVEIAKTYEQNGAACLSVLTDEKYFQGHDDYLEAIRAAVDLPILRKDFMIDPYQIYESRALGADCILLIMACLTDEMAKELYDLAMSLKMGVLVEVHDQEELDRALAFEPKMIGVNNRDLKTLNVSLNTGLEMAKRIPDSVFKIAESGFSAKANLHLFAEAGYGAFLIGEGLMRQDDIGAALKELVI
ncbi:MAG: indole-3-glycerol phosphate synthase TrpC [Pseudomonadota bacterium]